MMVLGGFGSLQQDVEVARRLEGSASRGVRAGALERLTRWLFPRESVVRDAR